MERPPAPATPDDADGTGPADEIRLTLPTTPGYARVARLAIAGLASRNGFSYDEVEDLRIAIGELFGLLAGDGSDATSVTFACRLPGDAIEVDVQGSPAGPMAVTDLSAQILAAVVDELEVDASHGRAHILKRAEAAA